MIVFLLLALLGLGFSLAVHLSTFTSNRPPMMSQVWPLHVAIFVVFVPMIIAQKRWGDPSSAKKRGSMGDMFSMTPKWMRIAFTICFFYAIANFVIFMVREQRAGKVRNENGKHVLVRDRQAVRELSEEEYRVHEARVARGFSGHWLIFYGASVLGLYDAILRKRRAEELAMLVGGSDAPGPASSKSPYAGRSPRLTPLAHSILSGFVSGFGFLAAPISVAFLFMRLFRHAGGGAWNCCFVPLFFGSGLVGLAVATLCFQRVPARCPSCGGRAFGRPHSRAKGGGWTYCCRDCGETHSAS
jgi:hypothetical protein